VLDFLNRGRWYFDPQRGLMRTCKNPQRDDSSLRKYWTKERLEIEKAAIITEVHGDNDVEIKPGKSNANAKPTKRATKGCKNIKVVTPAFKAESDVKKKTSNAKRARKPIVIAESDKDTSVSDVSDAPSPKRPRRLGKSAESIGTTVVPYANASSTKSVPTCEVSAGAPKENQSIPAAMPATALSHDLEVGSTAAPGMLQAMMSIAYDTAAINARRLELERREQEIERKERRQQDRDDKFLFMSQAAESFKHFLHLR
jgi:hypothetical protein